MKIKVRRESSEAKRPPAAISSLLKENRSKKAKKAKKLQNGPQAKLKATKTVSKKEDEDSGDSAEDVEFSDYDDQELNASDSKKLEEHLRAALEKKFSDKANVSLSSSESEEESEMDQSISEAQNMSLGAEEKTELTKAQRKRRKRTEAKQARREENAKKKKPKKTDEEPPTSSSIVLPKPQGFVSLLDTDEKRLNAARARLAEVSSHVLQIRPVPRKCTPGLLKDLCPLAVHIRFPTKSGARYAFLQFRNEREMKMAQEMLATKRLNDKPLTVRVCSSSARDETEWRPASERQMSEFNWKRLHVAHLARSTTRFDLGQVFRKASAIIFPTYEDGSSKGVCWLKYRHPKDALKAFETRHGTFIRGSPIYVNFALCQKPKPKEEPVPELPDEPEPEFVVTNKKRTRPDSDESASENEEEGETGLPAKAARLAKGNTAEEFVIDRKKSDKPVEEKREFSHPKLLNKHQLRKKGGGGQSKNTTLASLETLLRPPEGKPKNAKKSKKVTKRGKPSKHR